MDKLLLFGMVGTALVGIFLYLSHHFEQYYFPPESAQVAPLPPRTHYSTEGRGYPAPPSGPVPIYYEGGNSAPSPRAYESLYTAPPSAPGSQMTLTDAAEYPAYGENMAPIPVGSIRDSIPGGTIRYAPKYFASIDAEAPLISSTMLTPFQQIGLLVSFDASPKNLGISSAVAQKFFKKSSQKMLNLYARPIAPNQDVWQYYVTDKDGFRIPLENKSYLENGDVVDHVTGKGGPWETVIYDQNRYVYL